MSAFTLILQAPCLTAHALNAVHTLAGGSHVARLNDTAARIFAVDPTARAAVVAYCEDARIDYAYLNAEAQLSDYGLLVSDMDSTLIEIECIDEIAALYGIKAQVAAITERSMAGDIDFATSLTQRVALLAGLEESALARVYDEHLTLMPGTERLIARLRQVGIKTLLVSGGFTYFTDRLKTQLGLDGAVGNQLEIIDGRLTGRLIGPLINAQAKADHLILWRERLGLRRNQTLAIGDGANDLCMLAEAGLGIGVHPKPRVYQAAALSLRFVGLDGILHLFGESSP